MRCDGLGALFSAGVGEVGDGRCHVDGGEGADDYAEEHCEGEGTDGVAAEDEDAEEHEDCRARGHDRTAEGRVDRVVDGREEILLGEECSILAHAVEYNHGVVDLVTDYRQDGGDEGLVDFHCEGKHAVEDRVEADDDECREGHSGEGAEGEGHVAEADENVEEHRDEGDDYGDVGVRAHVVGDGGADLL